MKTKKSFFASLAALSLAGGVFLFSPAQSETLPDSVVTALRTALDDEYKAYATYDVVIKSFGEVRPFTNIIQAEERHIAFLKPFFEENGLAIPENPYLSDSKKPTAPASVKEACEIGVQAEIANAALYDDNILPAVKDYPEMVSVAERLRDASRNNHLAAFQRCVDRGGQMGRGGGRGQGQGGPGWRNRMGQDG